MKRRNLLRTIAILPLLADTFPGLFGPAKAAPREVTPVPLRRERPSDPAWPGPASWSELKQEVGGNLIKVQPLFATCAAEPQGAECIEALKNATNPFYLGDQ